MAESEILSFVMPGHDKREGCDWPLAICPATLYAIPSPDDREERPHSPAFRKNREQTRTRHQAPVRRLQREILRPAQDADRLPDLRGGVCPAEGCAVAASPRLRAAAGDRDDRRG